MPRLVDETYKTLGHPEAAHALVLMEELGLFDLVLPILAAHLHAGAAPRSPSSRPVRNLAALGRAIAAGTLARSLDRAGRADARPLQAWDRRTRRVASTSWRSCDARGFARGDTEQMRLMLEALPHLATPTRRTRRLIQRPYFADARMFFEMTAPAYSAIPRCSRASSPTPTLARKPSDERRRVEPPRDPDGSPGAPAADGSAGVAGAAAARAGGAAAAGPRRIRTTPRTT